MPNIKIPKYGVYYKGYLFFNDIYKYIKVTKIETEIENDENFTVGNNLTISINETYRYLEIKYKDIEDLKKVPYLAIIKENIEELPDGLYELYPIFYLNEIPCIASRILKEHLFCIYYVEGLDKNYVKKVDTTKKIGNRIIGDVYYVFALKSSYIPVQDLITGVISQESPDIELINWFIDTELLYPISDTWSKNNFGFLKLNSNRTKFSSYDSKIYKKDLEGIYLDGYAYAAQVIDTLKKAYPEIHFFATPSDWGKSNNYKDISAENKKTYSEWIRYTIGHEDYTTARRDFFKSCGPVILNAKLKIEFEYATLATDIFRQRRTDFFLDQFLSYYSKDHISLDFDIVGDNSKILGFAINWIKDDMLFSDPTKGSDILENTNLDIHKMNFQCELFFAVIRYNMIAPPILKGILKIIDRDDTYRKDDITIEHEATDKQKEYILNKYEEGKFLNQGDILLLENPDYSPEKEPSEKGDLVEINHPIYKKDHESID